MSPAPLTCLRIFAHWSAYEKIKENDPLHTEIEAELVYLKHPFDPDLCSKLTKLPAGFRNLALSRKLSIQCVDFIQDIMLTAEGDNDESSGISKTSDMLLRKPGLTILERLLATALSTYMALGHTQTSAPNPNYVMLIQHQIKLFASSEAWYSCSLDVLDWACLMLRATTERNTASWRWADATLHTRKISDERRAALGVAFLPIPPDVCSF